MDGDKGRGAGVHGGHFLEHQRGIQPGQGQPANGFWCVQPTKAQLSSLCNRFAREDALRIPLRRMGGEGTLRKLARSVGKGALVFAQFKVHGGLLFRR